MTGDERPARRAYEPIEPVMPVGAPDWENAEPFFDVSRDASANDCTGLMPAIAQDPFEGMALSEIESIHRIKGKNENN